jgi:hypothetical protein
VATGQPAHAAAASSRPADAPNQVFPAPGEAFGDVGSVLCAG